MLRGNPKAKEVLLAYLQQLRSKPNPGRFQPRLAEALGLIVSLDVSLDAAPRLENGGWLWVELAARGRMHPVGRNDDIGTVVVRTCRLTGNRIRRRDRARVVRQADQTMARAYALGAEPLVRRIEQHTL